jgi:hypothetical protein
MTIFADDVRRRSLRRSGVLETIFWRRSIVILTLASIVLASGALFFTLQAEPPATKLPGTPSSSTPAPVDTTALDSRVIAYYFHTNYRCASCRQIEAYSHEAVATAFPKELESGRLVWRLVNVEEKGNEHFVKDYGLFTKSLVLVEEKKGEQVRWKNLAKVWELLGHKERFFAYVQNEVRGYLIAMP